MKKFLIWIFTVIFVFICAIGVYADEKKLIESYDRDTGEYRYYLDEDNYVTSSQQLGKIVENAVKLTYNDDVDIELKKDGKTVKTASGGFLLEEGNYVLTISNSQDSASTGFIIKRPDIDIDEENVFYSVLPITQAYSAKEGMYTLSVGDDYTFYSDVPDGAVTDKDVKVYTPYDEKLDIKVYKDGGEISFSSGKTFSQSGYYVFEVMYDTSEDEEITDEEIFSGASTDEINALNNDFVTDAELNDLTEGEKPEFDSSYLNIADMSRYSFCIIKGDMNNISFLSPPSDYIISSVTVNGKKQQSSKSFLRAEKDGSYNIIFKNEESKLPDYTFNFTKDTVPPTLSFENVGKGGIARGSFGIIKNQEDSEVKIYKNGELREDISDTVEEEGLYRIIVSDNAQNTREYLVRLKKGYGVYVIYWTVAVVAAISVIILYASYVGKNIHIR